MSRTPRKGGWRALCAAWMLCAGACTAESGSPLYPNLGATADPHVGLYTPGSTLGATMRIGLDAGADGSAGDVSGDRCTGEVGDAGTKGMLSVEYMTTVIGEHWAPANVGAVWIEDAAGGYVKTIERWAALRVGSLYRWNEHACVAAWPEMDVMAMATLPNHNTMHHAIWTTKDWKGNIVPDGTYRLFIEVTETELNYGPLAMYDFEKGTKSVTLMPPDKPPHKGLKISYEPTTSSGP